MSLEDTQFGESVRREADRLKESGIDPNQIANILWKNDKVGHNYGIGIILDGQGRPAATSDTLLDYASQEVAASVDADYRNSSAIMEKVKESVLRWQRIPQAYWPQFRLLLPSDAGTGAVQSGIQTALLLNPDVRTLAVEELGWPAYKAMAKVAQLSIREFPQDGVVSEAGVLPLYQAGPMNTTGLVKGDATVNDRARVAARDRRFVLLDRAYPGFEFARLLPERSYDDVMTKSYELQLKPFLEAGTPFILAISPTKAFVSFSLRPCGFLLVFNPGVVSGKDLTSALNTVIRARGSSFEHCITRAFTKALVRDLPRLEDEHRGALLRLSGVEKEWKALVKGTAIEAQFSDSYAGLFRNPKVSADASRHIYHEHLYPVFAEGRCRLNATGLPSDKALARRHVDVFASFCS
jgi:hypothetical protein